MGLYDTLTFEDGLEIDFPDVGADPFEITWQTKTVARDRPRMRTYEVTANGRLFEQEVEYERVPEEERPGYDGELEGFESEFAKGLGSLRDVPQGWSDTEYHGTFEFHAVVDDEYVSLEATFTDGQLVAITRSE